MTRDDYLTQFERWVGGGKELKARARGELEEHLDGAEEAGDLCGAMQRLGDPRSAARDFTSGSAAQPAPLPRRFAAALLDLVIFVALFGGGMATGTWTTSRSEALNPEDLTFDFGSGSWYLTSISWVGITLVAAGVLWWVLLVPVLEWRTGRTLGKAAFGLRVMAEDGTAPSFGQIVLRRLSLVFSGPLQLFDWAFVFFNAKRQRAFDTLAKTMVMTDSNKRGAS